MPFRAAYFPYKKPVMSVIIYHVSICLFWTVFLIDHNTAVSLKLHILVKHSWLNFVEKHDWLGLAHNFQWINHNFHWTCFSSISVNTPTPSRKRSCSPKPGTSYDRSARRSHDDDLEIDVSSSDTESTMHSDYGSGEALPPEKFQIIIILNQ